MFDDTELLASAEYVKLTFSLFAISTPLAAVPIYTARGRSEAERPAGVPAVQGITEADRCTRKV